MRWAVTSIGAIIGAGVANMWDTEEMSRIYYEAFVRGKPLSDWTLPFVALTRGTPRGDDAAPCVRCDRYRRS